MVLNNETKFHIVIIKTIHLREQTSFQLMIFHKLRAITHGTKQCDQVSYDSDKNYST